MRYVREVGSAICAEGSWRRASASQRPGARSRSEPRTIYECVLAFQRGSVKHVQCTLQKICTPKLYIEFQTVHTILGLAGIHSAADRDITGHCFDHYVKNVTARSAVFPPCIM